MLPQARCCISSSTPLKVKPRAVAGELRGALRAVRGIAAQEGVRGLFAGYGSFLLRDLPFDAIEFVAYEQLKKSYKVGLCCLHLVVWRKCQALQAQDGVRRRRCMAREPSSMPWRRLWSGRWLELSLGS